MTYLESMSKEELIEEIEGLKQELKNQEEIHKQEVKDLLDEIGALKEERNELLHGDLHEFY